MKTATQLKKELMRHIFSSSISFFYTKNEFLILLKHFKIKMQRLLVLKEKNNSLDPVTQINSGVCSVMYIWIVSVVLKKGTVIIIKSDPRCMQRWQCSIYKGSLETSDKKCGRYLRFSDSKSVYLCKFFLPFLKTRNAQVTANENKQFKETKTLIYIHQTVNV